MFGVAKAVSIFEISCFGQILTVNLVSCYDTGLQFWSMSA